MVLTRAFWWVNDVCRWNLRLSGVVGVGEAEPKAAAKWRQAGQPIYNDVCCICGDRFWAWRIVPEGCCMRWGCYRQVRQDRRIGILKHPQRGGGT